jgi:hypothetical protein
VWFFDKPVKNDLHPTMKPVALVERTIRNSSKSRDIVLDPFGGSGTTLMREPAPRIFMAVSLTAWSEQRGIPYQGVPVGTIKRHVTGKGNADKAVVIVAVRARGFTPADDNEADAIAILLWAIDTAGGVR